MTTLVSLVKMKRSNKWLIAKWLCTLGESGNLKLKMFKEVPKKKTHSSSNTL